MIVTNLTETKKVGCLGCGNYLFEIQPGRFEYYSGTIECSNCHRVHDLVSLLHEFADGQFPERTNPSQESK